MTIAVNHSTLNNGKPMVNHANIHPYCFKTFETNIKFQFERLQAVYLILSSKKKTLSKAIKHFSPWLTINFYKKIIEISEIFNF